MLTPHEFVDELEKGLGESEGDLVLGIFCRYCNAHFELGKGGAAMAILTSTSFLEYLRFVQGAKCPNCHPSEGEIDEKEKRILTKEEWAALPEDDYRKSTEYFMKEMTQEQFDVIKPLSFIKNGVQFTPNTIKLPRENEGDAI